jgi:DNA-binding response OmpR family regulator
VIFLLENSTDYLFLLDQAFRKSQLLNPLRVARYGNEAILYLKGVGVYHDRLHYPLPDLILLDLTVPDGSGPAVLGWIRRHPSFNHVPVVILEPLTSIANHNTFDREANAYHVNRNDFQGLVRLVKSIDTCRQRESEGVLTSNDIEF